MIALWYRVERDRHHRRMTTQTLPQSGVERLGARAWGMLLVLCGALFLDAMDVSMVGVALPSIRTDLDMSTSSLQWVVSAYVLGYGGFLLLGGRAADLLGRRRVFLISLGVFVVASALGGLVDDGSLLIAASSRASAQHSPRPPGSRSSRRASPKARRGTRRSRSTPRPVRPASRWGSCSVVS
jgi:Major Facilitator Superfamily